MNYKHGKVGTTTYNVWSSMLARCRNPNCPAFPNYGGRGIDVCDAWISFKGFLADMGERPEGLTLERIDNDRGYGPDNCRWATRSEQGRNKRSTRLLTVDGQTLSMAEWSERTGLKISTIWARIAKGWPESVAVTTPLITERKGKPRGSRLFGAERGVKFYDGDREAGAPNKAPADAAA